MRNAKKKIFVGNLPFTVNNESLSELFKPFGEIVEIKIPTDREKGTPRGFAFVEFGTQQAAENAISKLNDSMFNGRKIVVSLARSKTTPGGGNGGGGGRRGYGGGRDDHNSDY